MLSTLRSEHCGWPLTLFPWRKLLSPGNSLSNSSVCELAGPMGERTWVCAEEVTQGGGRPGQIDQPCAWRSGVGEQPCVL